MNEKNILLSLKVPSRNRTYFLDVKQEKGKAKYLQICESKQIDHGHYEKQRITIFEEDIHKIVAALHTAYQHFTTDEDIDMKLLLQKIRNKYANAYKPWTDEDDVKLTELFCQGKTPKQLSEIFERNVGAINARIKKLELKEKYG